MPKISHVSVRMYRMGTGDCFVLKFYAGKQECFKMMIDCGTWSGREDSLNKYITNLKEYVNNKIDVLVITHEHKDHVHGFDVCKKLLTNNFKIDQIWMGWTENDKNPKVKKWQKDFGDKKKALALAAQKLQSALNDPGYRNILKNEFNGMKTLAIREQFSLAIDDLNVLHNNVSGATYKGGLAGMEVVKNMAPDNTEYYSPGDIIEQLPGLEGIKFYILGPPQSWENEVKVQDGGKGESYDHNNKLAECEAFAAAALMDSSANAIGPFDSQHVSTDINLPSYISYTTESWRKIDTDWLNSAGNHALRINSITNNLSLAFAIEFEDSGKVMLFPGDAEYGSWASWHTIPWDILCRNGKPHFTEDLLSRTIFYKVAHHLSHHGTAERLGMDMMTDPNLVAMATLDYKIISPNWKNTMPNRKLLKALVSKTKGRLIIMNDDDLFYDKENNVTLKDKLKMERRKMNSKEFQNFESAYEEEDLYLQFIVNGE